MNLRQTIGGLLGASILTVGSASAAILEMTSPFSTSFVEDTDFRVMGFSGVGDVTAGVTPVDIVAFTSGCEASDFAGFPAGNIALLRRGTCEFRLKTENAEAAGAVGVLIFNTGAPDNLGLLFGTLTANYTGDLPVMGLTHLLGIEAANTPGLAVHMEVTQADVDRVTFRVPEPGTIALLGIAIAGLGFSRRKRAVT
jgi:hypothetical protein